MNIWNNGIWMTRRKKKEVSIWKKGWNKLTLISIINIVHFIGIM